MADQHTGPRPHGISCPGCYAEKRCNHCGAENCRQSTGMCTHGRCPTCCGDYCVHQTSAGVFHVGRKVQHKHLYP